MADYYYIKSLKMFAKRERYKDYLYENGIWVEDEKNLVDDRLWGYDPSEPQESLYGIGNDDIMDDLEYITEKEFKERTSQKD